MRMRHAAYAATFVLLAALAATILLTSATAPQPASAAARAEPHSLAPAPVTPLTPLTPLPTYTLTLTAGLGGSVNPAGATTHTEGIPVTLTTSWNDATHTFAGWGGDCSGTGTTCVLEMYADHTVTASFTPLPADRCPTPTDADCIRAVYKGAPDDYAQVQDIPQSVLIQPDGDGRYQVERGHQYTVVTAAQLPEGYNRFYLRSLPGGEPWPTSLLQLVLPAGTTYTFTVSANERAASSLDFQLHAASAVVVTTAFKVPPPPPTLELASSRDLCTANTLTELSWTITGGKPPYALTIDGETVAANAESHRVNCGPVIMDPQTEEPLPNQSTVFSASVADSRATPESAAAEVRVALAEALPSVADVEPFAARSYVGISWPNYTRQNFNDTEAWYLFRSRPQGESEWRYERVPRDRANPREVHSYVKPHPEPPAQPIVQQLEVARTRHDIEAETPDALNWSPTLTVTSLIPASGIRLTATHDSVTVRWDPQASSEVIYEVAVGTRDREPYSGDSKHVWLQPGSKHEITFSNLLPSTEYHAYIAVRAGIETMETRGPTIRTAAAPHDYEPFPIGPQNLRVTNVTNTSISVRWDRPFAGASEGYGVWLFRVDWPNYPVLQDSGHGYYQARFNNLEPGTDYVVWVTHYGTVRETARLPVSTLPLATPPRKTKDNPEPEAQPIWFHDGATEAMHKIRGENTSLTGSNIDRVITIARSLFEPPVQPQLGNLTSQRSLDPNNNHLIRAIPSSLRRLVNLEWLLLQDSQLTGPLPSQLAGLMQLTNVSLPRSAGFSGCVPLWLRRMLDHQIDWLSLPNCRNDASATPTTPAALEPTYTLTVIAGEGGSINPPGTTTHTKGVPVTLTTSWNDATHTFAGWSGACSGSDTTCTLEMYANASVTAAFTPLPADRCTSPTDADCIRAVYKGAPDDYAQVQNIPDSVLIHPDDDGRYQVERGQQITVVTAAPLPASYTRFYLQQDPVEQPWPVSSSQLILPVGTTYTFTPSTDPAAADLITFDLHAARPWPFQRPGLKPELGDVIVRTTFAIPPPPLTLELASSRDLCTANTLTELSWTISGGRPPYTLSIDGQTVDANAESHRANCGPIPTDPFTGDPIPASSKRWTATVSDSQPTTASVSQRIETELVEPLAPPPLIWMSAFGTRIAIAWTETEEHRAAVWYGKGGVYAIRFRLEDTIAWTYAKHHTGPVAWIELPAGDMTVQMAVLRAPIEQATPQALRWSENHRIARVEEPANATAVATHDTVTVSWDRQPLTGNHGDVTITAMDARASALARNFYEDPDDPSTRFSFTFEHLPPDSDYEVTITYGSLGIAAISRTLEVRTQEAPENWQPLPSGPHNLRATAGHRWITVQWDPPFVGAEPSYLVQIIDESDGTQIDSKATKQTEWTSYGSFRPVWPSTEYRISVLHTAIPEVEAEITITTPEPSDDES